MPSPPTRPWFTSPLLPIVVCLAGITALLLDGLTPWRTFTRRRSWTTVKGRLASAVERRTKLRSSARGDTRMDYLVKRSQRRVFSKVVTRGWPLKNKKRVWIVRITYTYPWKGGRITRVADSPAREFDSHDDAQAFLAKRLHKKGAVRVWVNPKEPREATVFLDYSSVPTLVIGFVMLGLGLLWLIVTFLLKRVHVRQEAL
jgi:Protein of unknown function (DUF3592)